MSAFQTHRPGQRSAQTVTCVPSQSHRIPCAGLREVFHDGHLMLVPSSRSEKTVRNRSWKRASGSQVLNPVWQISRGDFRRKLWRHAVGNGNGYLAHHHVCKNASLASTRSTWKGRPEKCFEKFLHRKQENLHVSIKPDAKLGVICIQWMILKVAEKQLLALKGGRITISRDTAFAHGREFL